MPKTPKKDTKKALAGSRDKSDDLWKLLEEGYLPEIVSLKDHGAQMHALIKQGYAPTTTEVAVAIMASLAFGEILRRKLERAAFEKSMINLNKKIVHITLKKPQKGTYSKIGKCLAKAIGMTEINQERLKKYGILSGLIAENDIPASKDYPNEIDSVTTEDKKSKSRKKN